MFDEDHAGNHVVVVENSADYRVSECIEANHKSEKVLVEVASRNEGFSHGVNFGYRLAQNRWGSFDFVVLLNPDVISAGFAVCELVNRAASQSDRKIGVCGPVLRDPVGNIDRGCARRVWNRRRFFSHVVGYDNLVSIMGTRPRILTEYEIRQDQIDLALVCGALMCIDADLLGSGLDTLLPMYLEDQEICMRCIKEGRRVVVYPDLEAVHAGGVSRKSLTGHDRALRTMELIEAPVQCMVRLQGYSRVPLRLIVIFGGVSRILAASLAGVFKVILRSGDIPSQVAWMSEQRRLGMWFVEWAIKGPFHDKDISLSEYFGEYAEQRSTRRRSVPRLGNSQD